MELSIQDLGAIGEMIGAIAVVITLMYLASQINQNTVAVKASAMQSLAVATSEVWRNACLDFDRTEKFFEIAKKENKTPKEIIDKYDSMIKDAFKKFDISFDNYSRTSKKIHHETASEFFKNLNKKNVFVEKESKQLYDNQAKQFLADRFVKGICPICNEDEAYGDQCESCGSSLSANELIDPKSTISNSKPILKKTKHWYLPLNKYEKFIKSNNIEIAGIEYIIDKNGIIYTYDVNTNTNYNSQAERNSKIKGMKSIAEFLKKELLSLSNIKVVA